MGQQRKRWFLTGIFKLNPKVHRERGTDEGALWLLLASHESKATCLLIGDQALAVVPVTALVPASPDEVTQLLTGLSLKANNNHLPKGQPAKAT